MQWRIWGRNIRLGWLWIGWWDGFFVAFWNKSLNSYITAFDTRGDYIP